MNDCFGLGSKSEEGLEALNKNIRHLREHGARKVSIKANFHDVYLHMWRRSRPFVVALDREKTKKKREHEENSDIGEMMCAMFLSPSETDQDSAY